MWDTPLYGTVGQGLKVSHLSEFDCNGFFAMGTYKNKKGEGSKVTYHEIWCTALRQSFLGLKL